MHFSAAFWVALAFVILIALLYKPVGRLLVSGLDGRISRIKSELDEAIRLREEAQALLNSIQRKQDEALKEASRIVAHAKEEAGYALKKAHEDLEHSVNQRIAMTMQKISASETRVIQDIANQAVEKAVALVEERIGKQLNEQVDQQIILASVSDIKRNLQ